MKRDRIVVACILIRSVDGIAEFRQIFDDWTSAREDVGRWFRDGYVDITASGSTAQDYYPAHQIVRVRLKAFTRVVTGVKPSMDPGKDVDEVAHIEDESGQSIDPLRVPL